MDADPEALRCLSHVLTAVVCFVYAGHAALRLIRRLWPRPEDRRR